MPIENINKEQETSNLETPTPSLSARIGTESARILMIGSGVAAILAIPDVLMHAAHTGKSMNGLLSGAIFTTAAKAAVKGYPSSVKASTIKNSTLNQRHNLQEHVETAKEVQEAETAKDAQETETILQKYPLWTSATIAALIGITDTTLTQFYANKKIWAYQEVLNSTFKTPAPSTAQEYYQAFKVGYNIRAAKNITNVAGFLITPRLKTVFTEVAPETNYIDTPGLMAAITCGSTVGSISNVFDIVYKMQAISVSQKCFATPSTYDTLKSLVAKEGLKGLRRGLPGSIMYTSTAYLSVPKVEEFVDNTIDYAKNMPNCMSFFKKAAIKKHPLEDAVNRQNEERNNPFSAV